jgi:hypothetical protein
VRRLRLLAIVVVAGSTAGSGASAPGDTAIAFDEYPAGTIVTNQYANAGGTGLGVVFGPLPAGAGGDGLRPVVRTPPAGQAHSASNVADIATCNGCESFRARTTATFGVARSRVSVYVGYLGDRLICNPLEPNSLACAFVTLRAVDRTGAEVATSTVRVSRGAGVHTPLSVSTSSATIVGFEISAREDVDNLKQIAIDELAFDTPAAPPMPDFTLNPAATILNVRQGSSATDAITIGRLNGSTGNVSLRADGLPQGVRATFAPNPAPAAQSVLTLDAGPDAPATTKTVTVTGTPESTAAGSGTRTFSLSVTVQPACPLVRTAKELVDKVAERYTCIYVEDTATIDLTEVNDERVSDQGSILVIPEGVTLMSGRSPTRLGGMLEMKRYRKDKISMLKLGENARVTGLRLRGYNQRDTKFRDDETSAIFTERAGGVVVENNEIFGWPKAAVFAQFSPTDGRAVPRISGNFLHHNVQCGRGYGVVVGHGGFANIDRNVFDYNRHDVAGVADDDNGYVAELNFSLTSAPTCPGTVGRYYNQHYDMHGTGEDGYGGTAGLRIEVRRNTIRGAQKYYVTKRRPAFMLRGTPADKAIFAENAVPHGSRLGSRGAVRVAGTDGDGLVKRHKLVIENNRLCVDTASEVAVGDFNGDGRDDVFQSVGTLWMYAPSGLREWHFLNESKLRLERLGLGDFDGDGKTDVFSHQGGRWLVSYGGTSGWTPLAAGSGIAVDRYHFGDFDGDRKTDVFWTNGSRWFYSSAGATGWQPLAASRFPLDELRFGDFDGDGRTDVFSLADGRWSVSYGGRTAWGRLNTRLESRLRALVFADFNGDRRTDIARRGNGNWQVSWSGATGWRILQHGRRENLAVGMLFGDFTGDGRDDALQYGEPTAELKGGCWVKDPLLQPLGEYKLSASGGRPWVWSYSDMR